MTSLSAATLVEMFYARAAADGDREALLVKQADGYRPLTWSELAARVRSLAAVQESLGVGPGDCVAQGSENRWEWIVADLAIQTLAAVHTPMHAALSAAQIAWQVKNCEAKVLLVSGEVLEKLASAKSLSLPEGLRIIAYDAPSRAAAKSFDLLDFNQLLDSADRGRGFELEQQSKQIVLPETLATLLYTSGTTGDPRGVMLSQENLTTNTLATLAAFDQQPQDVRLGLLPLSHIFARTCDLYTWIARGSVYALAQSRETIMADISAVGPSLINAVPYFYDKVYRGLCEKGVQNAPGVLQKALGGNIRVCCSGGAALPEHLFDYFESQGVPILQGYGLSETSPVITASSLDSNRRGCVGRPIPEVEVKIADDGEILTRGPHVMQGYWKNPAATGETIQDGWLHTGDLGELDGERFLRIIGRKKEILVTSSGKNVPAVQIESLLLQSPFILQVLVVGEGRSHLGALIVPDPEQIKAEIKRRKIRVFSRQGALKNAKVRAIYQEEIEKQLADVADHEQVRRFTLLDRGFTVENGELTPTLKSRRAVIEEHCRQQIEEMYR